MTPGAAGEGTEARRSPKSVVARLRIAFSLLVALALLGGLAGLIGLVVVSRGFDRTSRASRVLARGALDPSQSFLAMTSTAGRYEVASEPTWASSYRDARTSFDTSIARAKVLTTDRAVAQRLDAVIVAERAWEQRIAAPIFAGRTPVGSTEDRIVLSERVQNAIQAVRDRVDANSRRDAAEASTVRRNTILVVSLLAVLALLAGLAGSAFAATSLSRPLADLGAAVGRMTRREVGARAPLDGPTEIEQVASAVNVLAEVSEQSDRANEETRRIRELSQSLATRIRESLDLGAVLVDGVREVGLALHADRAIVRLSVDGRLGRLQTVWTADGVAEPVSDVAELSVEETSAMEHRLRAAGAIQHFDVRSDPPSSATLRRWHEIMGARSVVAVPLVAEDRFLGSLALYQVREPRQFTDREVELLRTVSTDFARGVLQAQLYQRSQELVRRLRDVDQSKTEFISTVSHELRTPLTSVIAYLELLREGDAGEITDEQAEMLEVIDRNLTRLHHLIEDLLTVSRIEAASFSLIRSAFVVGTALDEAITMTEPIARAAGVEICRHDDLAGTVIHGDPRQLYRIFANLLTNAVKFSPPGTRVDVWSTVADGAAVIEISDEGIGIPAADQDRLFTRFFRAANAASNSIPGTGLGLAIAREVAEEHGGGLTIESREGEGTVARVSLPVLRPS